MDINPAVIKAIGKPANASGTSDIANFSRTLEISTNASTKPKDAPIELNIVCVKLYPSFILIIATPSTIQLVVISGK